MVAGGDWLSLGGLKVTSKSGRTASLVELK